MGRAGKERGARGCGTVKTVPYCLAGERGRRERTGGGVVGKWRRERKRGERVRNGQDRSLLFGGGGEGWRVEETGVQNDKIRYLDSEWREKVSYIAGLFSLMWKCFSGNWENVRAAAFACVFFS